MDRRTIAALGVALANARIAKQPANVDLRVLQSIEDAMDVQHAAVAAYDGARRGYTLTGTSAATARMLNCWQPVDAPLFDEDLIDDGALFRLPFGTLGAGAQFIFMIGVPLRRERTTLRIVRDAIVSCHVGIQLLGRRVPHAVPLNDWSATADFALDICCVLGRRIEIWDEPELSSMDLSLLLNDNVVAKGRGADVFGNPLSAVLLLADRLKARGTELQAGDLIATGSCTGIAQIVPGQIVRASFGRSGDVALRVE